MPPFIENQRIDKFINNIYINAELRINRRKDDKYGKILFKLWNKKL